jgi:hypothetical protein
MMKNLTIALSIAAAVCTSFAVSAQERAEYSGYTGFVSAKARAEVKAELAAYRKTHAEVSDDVAAL